MPRTLIVCATVLVLALIVIAVPAIIMLVGALHGAPQLAGPNCGGIVAGCH